MKINQFVYWSLLSLFIVILVFAWIGIYSYNQNKTEAIEKLINAGNYSCTKTNLIILETYTNCQKIDNKWEKITEKFMQNLSTMTLNKSPEINR